MKKLGLLFILFGMLSPLAGFAAPFSGEETFTYTQPDGSTFSVRLFGDEYFAIAQTLDGHVVVRDPLSGFFCYAELSSDGTEYVSTGIEVGRSLVTRATLPPTNLLISATSRMKKHTEGRSLLHADAKGRTLLEGADSLLRAPPSYTTTGDRVGLVLLVAFPDRAVDVTISEAEVDAYCNQPGYSNYNNYGSVYDYYYTQSQGRLRYTGVVTAYYTALHDRDYYTDNTISYGTRARELIVEALNHLKATGFDFTRCDADGNGIIDGVNTFYAGTRVNAWGEGLWPHKSGLYWSGATGTGVSGSLDYQITDMTISLKLGTYCHENGHMLCGFPDLYDYGYESTGVGYFSLMANSGTTRPRNVDDYLGKAAGWKDITDITSNSHFRAAVRVGSGSVYRYKNPANTKEYFLVSVKAAGGWEIPPDEGLVVWHVDEAGDNDYEQMTAANHYELSVEQADGLVQLERNASYGGSGDLFHSGYKTDFSDSTLPDARWWTGATGGTNGSGAASGLKINTISVSGETMTFIVGDGALTNAAEIGLDESVLDVHCDYGAVAAAQKFAVWNKGTGTLSYAVADDAAWMSCLTASGTATTEADIISISFDTASLNSGSYTGTVTVTAAGAANSPQTLTVNLTVAARPGVWLSTNAASLFAFYGEASTVKTVSIANIGGGTLGYTLSNTVSWLQISPSNGTVSTEVDTFYISADTTALESGLYTGRVQVLCATATNLPKYVDVELTVSGAPDIAVAPSALSFSAQQGQTNGLPLNITNSGTGTLTFSLSNDLEPFLYSWADSDTPGGPVYSWIDISAIGTELGITDDGVSDSINCGFDFPFYGNTYTQLQVGGNGGLLFSSSGVLYYNNAALPSGNASPQAIFAFWDDLNPQAAGSIFYHSTPERLVVSWLGVPRYGTATYETFQTILYPDGRIVFQYQNLNGILTGCTVGIQGNDTGSDYVQMVYNAAYLKNNLAVEISPPAPNWLGFSATNGSLAAAASTSVWLTADTADLEIGVYTARVTVASNDPDTPAIEIPAIFTVSESDTDSDGIPDSWEALYFGGVTNANPSGLAANGVNTIEESYIAGLNPTNPLSIFTPTDASLQNDHLVFGWTSASGRVYTIYWASNLFSAFQPMQSNYTGGVFTDTVHDANNDGFYRIEVQLAP